VYGQLADAFANSKDKVIIAKVDADGNGKPLGQKYGVSGFPSTSSTISLVLELNMSYFSPKMVQRRWQGRAIRVRTRFGCFSGIVGLLMAHLSTYTLTSCSVTQKSGVKSNIKPPPAPEYRILDYKDFDEVALVGVDPKLSEA